MVCCGTVVSVSVRVAARIPDALAERISARASSETRTLSNMIERLLELGLGVVEITPLITPEACPNRSFHAGAECGRCGWKPKASREVTPDWKVKP